MTNELELLLKQLPDAHNKWEDLRHKYYDQDTFDYDLEDIYPSYGERYKIASDKRVPTGETGTVYDITDDSVSPREVPLTKLSPAVDNDIIDKSNSYVYGSRNVDPTTGELISDYFSPVQPGDLSKLLDKEIEYVDIIRKDDPKLIEYVKQYLAGPKIRIPDAVLNGVKSDWE